MYSKTKILKYCLLKVIWMVTRLCQLKKPSRLEVKLNFAPDWRKLWANKHKIKISRQKRWTTRLGDATGWVLQSSLGAIEASRRWHKSLSLCHKSTPNDSQDHCERKLQTMSFGYWRIKTFFELDLQRFIILFRLHFTVAGASFRVLRLTGGSRCLLRSSVSVWVSVWVIWRITNRHSVKYAELRIGILLKVCRFLIRHTLPNADVISSYHAVKYAELRIGILLEYCRFLIRHTLKVCRFLIRHTMR